MMIVTPEMQFARAIRERGFYADRGGVCSASTVHNIFRLRP